VISRAIACLLVVALSTTQVAAQPTATVMVLPIDGDADPALRTKLTAVVETAAKDLGTVKAGTTTLGETATAIGCDPATIECAERVRATLDVDILIHGTATAKDGQVELVIRKQEKAHAAVEARTMIIGEAPAMLDPATLHTLTGKPLPCQTADGTCGPQPLPKQKQKPRTDRVLGIAALIGGGVLLIGGLTLWNEKSKKQDQIDAAPTDTLADLEALEALEDNAGKKATAGNLLMVGAIGATVVGIWLLRRDRRAQREVRVTPVVTPTSAGVMLTIGAL